jgi:hypothetical protein
MSSYLHEMNHQVWWMVDIGLYHALEDYPETQGQKKCLYLEAHVSDALSSALSAEIKDDIKIVQMFGSSDEKRSSSTNIPANVSSSSIHIDQDQEEQSSVQKEKVKFVSLGKPDCPVSQTRVSGFGIT